MEYRYTVPSTTELGSATGVCRDTPMQTYMQDALWDYNSSRAHDGLPPLKRMPPGTRYIPIPQK